MVKIFRRMCALLVSVCVVSSALCMPVMAEGDETVYYYDSSSSTLNTRTDCEIMDENTTVLADLDDTGYNGTWYYLDKDLTFNTKVQVTGRNVRLIIKDGCTLTANAGIEVDARFFYIYNSSSQDNGKIVATSTNSAGIQVKDSCTLYIYGGTIEASGAERYAGIGGASDGTCGGLTVYGGHTEAQGGAGGAGIGAKEVYGFSLYGGSIEAKAGSGTAPGIGYWDSINYFIIADKAEIDAFGGSQGGPGIGYCGSGEPSTSISLIPSNAEGYIHAKGCSNAFLSTRSDSNDNTHFRNWAKMALFYGENGEKCALRDERDDCLDTLAEVWIRSCSHPGSDCYEDKIDSPVEHYHWNECKYCAYGTSSYPTSRYEDCHVFDSATHQCVCGHKEYPVVVTGAPNGWGYVPAFRTGLEETEGYVSAGRVFPLKIYSEDLGDKYCAKLSYVDPQTSTSVVLYQDNMLYRDDYQAYIATFQKDDEGLKMPETTVNIQLYEKYDVTFNAGEGSGSMDAVRACSYKDYILPVSEFTAPDGFTFMGWKVNNEDTVRAAGDFISLSGDTVLTAVYANEAAVPAFTHHSLVLAGQIGVRFRVKYPDSIDPSSTYMLFKGSDGRTGRMNYSAAQKLDDGTVVYTFYINPLELADSISATLYFGGGRKVGNVYSAMDYINTVMEDTTGAYDDEKDVVEALWNYGYNMQFARWKDNLSAHAEIPRATYITYDPSAVRTALKPFSKLYTAEAGINSVMYSLTWNSDTALNIFISLNDNVTVTSVEGATASGEVTMSGKKYIKYTIKGILPQDLNTLKTVKITTSLGNTAFIYACPMSYVLDACFVIPQNDYDSTHWKQDSLVMYYLYHKASLEYYQAHNT